VVTLGELAENDYNLNIRRYADNAPPPELHDVRAHLLGGVPRAEVEAQRPLLEAVGLDPVAIFAERDEDYLEFHPDLADRAQIKARIEADPGVQARAARLRDAFAAWWEAQEPQLAALPGSNDLFRTRNDLVDSFQEALLPVGMLDRYQVAGVVASWWNEIQYDLKTLAAQGFYGLVDSWIASIRASMEGEEARNSEDPLEHPLVQHLLPDYLEKLDALDAREAKLKARIAEGKQLQEDDEAEPDEVPTDEELTEMRRERRDVRRKLKALQDELLTRLDAARRALEPEETQELVLEIERERLEVELDRYATARRQATVAAVENWWDKYSVSLREIEAERKTAVEQLEGFVRDLRYAE
jgi:type I restriction enzyme M protein